ncbi:MAG: hypothetical protein ACOYIN_03020 [Christensenellales bacterium]|jgi:hypothetical protein
MENTKLKKFLLIMLVLMLVLSIVIFAACNDAENSEDPGDENEEEEEETEDPPRILNYDFSESTSAAGDFPLAPKSWTGTEPASVLPQKSADKIEAGIISVKEADYESKKSVWDDLANPGKKGTPEDDNMLMIYNKEPTVYTYTSTSFSVTADAIYKITIDVKTVGISGNTTIDEAKRTPGARIYFSSSTYAEFRSIDTAGEWKTFTFYIAGNVTSSNSLTLLLGLGYGSGSSDAGLTKGYAFFDNITIDEEVTINEYQEAQSTLASAENPVMKANLRGVGNGEFDFGSGAPSGSAYLFTSRLGDHDKDDNMAPTTNVNRKYGIVDTSKWADNITSYGETFYYAKVTGSSTYELGSDNAAKKAFTIGEGEAATLIGPGDSLPAGSLGTNIYMLYQSNMSAQSIQGNTPITVERGKSYRLTVSVYTYDIFGAGVSLVLKGGEEDIKIEGISKATEKNNRGSTGGWETYTFWIKGNPNRNITYTLQLWLGTGGKSDNNLIEKTVTDESLNYINYTYKSTWKDQTAGELDKNYFDTYDSLGTFSAGWAFFDNIALQEYADDTAFSGAVESPTLKKADLSLAASSIVVPDFTAGEPAATEIDDLTEGIPAGWSIDFDEDATTIDGVSTDGIIAGVADTFAPEWTLTEENPLAPYSGISEKVLIIKNNNSIFRLKSGAITIVKNSYYRYAVWVKTADIKKTSGIYLYLYNAKDDTMLSSFTAVNTAEIKNAKTNGWQEIVFKIQGSIDEDKQVYIELGAGSGSRWTPDTLADGTAFFAHANMEKLSYTEYTNISSSTYVKSYSFATTTATSFTNGAFNNIDLNASEGIVDGVFTGMKDGEVTAKFAVPQSFNLTDSTIKPDKLLTGVVNVNNTVLLNNLGVADLFGTTDGGEYTSTVYDDWEAENYGVALSGGPKFLMMHSVEDTGDGFAVGYKSNTFSMSASSYYKISVWVKTYGADTVAGIYLTSESPSTGGENYFAKINTQTLNGGKWTKFTFMVEVGLSSVSDAVLQLWLGVNKDIADIDELGLESDKSLGTVIFDSVEIESVDKEKFDEATAGNFLKKMSFFTDSFDSAASSETERTSVIRPAKWSGQLSSDGTSANTVSGVVDTRYVDIENTFGLQEVTDPEEDEEVPTPEEIAASKISAEALTARTGNRLLVINNIRPNGYSYVSNSYSLSTEKFYKVSVWVKTYLIEGSGAYIKLYLNSDESLRFDDIVTEDNEWVEYNFYVSTRAASLSSNITLGLGEFIDSEDESGLVSGYAMFDDIRVEEITADDFEEITGDENFSDGYNKAITMPASTDIDTGDGDEDDETVEAPKDFAWLWISSIVFSAVLLIAVIAILVKKYYKPRKKTDDSEPAYSKESATSEKLEEIKQKYKDFND